MGHTLGLLGAPCEDALRAPNRGRGPIALRLLVLAASNGRWRGSRLLSEVDGSIDVVV